MDTLAKILYLVKLKGLSDSDFAQQAGLYKTVLSEWRTGKTQSYLKHVPKISSVLGVTEEFLLSETAIKLPNNLQLNEETQNILLNISSLNPESIHLLNTFIDLLQAKETLNKQTK